MSWTTSTIGDVLNVIQNGINCKQAKDGVGDKISRIETISDASVNFNKVGYAVLTESEKHKGKLHKNDILFSHINSPIHVGKSALYAEEESLYHGINLLRLRVNNNIDSRFFNYFLNRLFWSGYWKRTAKQSVNQASVNQTDIKVVPFSYPPIPEQQRIVAILDQAFADIEKARANAEKNLKNARELFDSYLNQVFSQRGEGWVEISVGDVLTLEYGKPLDKSVRKENGLYPAYGANGVKTRSDEYYCETPSIIVGRKGSAGELTFTEDKYWPLDVTYYVGFNSSNYDLHFLYYMLARLNLPSLATGVKPGINRNVVYGLRVSVPPLNVQKNVAKKLKNIAHETSKVEGVYKEKLKSLDELKKSLLQKAFSGELTKTEGHAA